MAIDIGDKIIGNISIEIHTSVYQKHILVHSGTARCDRSKASEFCHSAIGHLKKLRDHEETRISARYAVILGLPMMAFQTYQ